MADGQTYHLVPGELQTAHAAGGAVRLHREGDRDGLGISTIELLRMGAA